MRKTLSALVWSSLVALGSSQAHAVPQKLTSDDQLSSKFRLNDDDPEGSVPNTQSKNANPLEFGYFLQDLLVQSEAARAAKDYPAFVRFSRALVKAVPERAKSWSKLCEAYDLISDPGKAVLACQQAVHREGAEASDFVRLAKLTLQKPEGLPATEVTELKSLLAHLEAEDPALAETVASLRCQLAVKVSDTPLLETCTAALAKLSPHDPKTIVYQWSLAVRKGQETDARRLFAEAKTSGVPEDNLTRMAKLTPGAGTDRARWLVAAVVCAGALAAFVYRSRQRRLSA